MNQQSHGQHKAVHPHPGQETGQASPGKPAATEGPKPAGSRLTAKKNETVLGPFTVRDLTVFASTLILFVASLIPMFASRYNLWSQGSLFFLGLGVILPLIVTALFVARRLTPESKVRVGSLSIDQFASVVASFALAFFFLAVAEAFVPSVLVALIGSLGLFAATVLARFIPFFAGDFLDRAEVPAHVVARESAVPFRKPSAPKEPKPAKEPGSSALAGWGKRLTVRATGGAGAAAGGAAQNGNRPYAGASADEAPDRATQSAAAQQGSPLQGSAQVSSQQPSGQQDTSRPGPAQPGSVQASDAVPVAAGSANAVAAPAGAGVAGAASAANSGIAASPTTQAADVVPPAAEQAQAAAVAPAASPATQAADVVPPAPQQPATQAAAGAGSAASAPAETMLHPQVMPQEPIGATVDPSSRPEAHVDQPVHEAFWFAVAQLRTAVDEGTGTPAFVIEPGGWVLALEDRGHEFLVQHTDGRVGVLRDLSNIERG